MATLPDTRLQNPPTEVITDQPMPSVPLSNPARLHEASMSYALCRTAFRLPTMAARIMQVAVSQVFTPEDQCPVVALRVPDILSALNVPDTGEARAAIRDALRILLNYVIEWGPDPAEEYDMTTLITRAHFSRKTDTICITFAPGITPHIANMQELFTTFRNEIMGTLTGDYAIRLFQILKSWDSMAGKCGNKKDEWFHVMTFDAIRDTLAISPKLYAGTAGSFNFKKRVIDGPVAEINAALVGFEVKTEYKKVNRKLYSVRFKCTLKPDKYTVAREDLAIKERKEALARKSKRVTTKRASDKARKAHEDSYK